MQREDERRHADIDAVTRGDEAERPAQRCAGAG